MVSFRFDIPDSGNNENGYEYSKQLVLKTLVLYYIFDVGCLLFVLFLFGLGSIFWEKSSKGYASMGRWNYSSIKIKNL